MQTIAICNLPEAKTYASKKSHYGVCLVLREKIISATIFKLKELGWIFGVTEEEYKTMYGGEFKLWLHDDCTICHSEITYKNNDPWIDYEVIDVASPQKTINLKTANTSSSATHCASCGNQLKDPGMGPTYKHCPKCEP